MAALMHNQGLIVAVEAIRNRYYRLKSVCSLLGVKNATSKLMDGRRFKPQGQLFDKILVDAPCSSEGRFNTAHPKTFAYWSPRKIKEMSRKQKGLLLAASRALKPGGTLVYSTCTFAPEENEAVVDWLLRKTEGAIELLPLQVDDVQSYPTLEDWQERTFSPEVHKCLRVLPAKDIEGFFLVKLIRKM